MSTAYYLVTDFCPHCKRRTETKIGTSFGGWRFLVELNRKQTGIQKLQDIENLIKQNATNFIVDEYDRKVTFIELMAIIKEHSTLKKHTADKTVGLEIYHDELCDWQVL